MANPTIITFLAEWDESVGPKIIDTYPESKKLELESITMQIFASFQAVFGTSGDVSFDRTNLILPLKSQKVTAKILLDAYKNKAVRGGRLPFVVVFLVPVQFVQRELDVYNDIQEEIVDHYTSKKEIKLAEYYDKIVNETSKLAEKVLDEAESSLKDKEYEEAVEQFRNVLF
nr:hypothetical protein [Candidatus Sigynarchaeota archaeon]